MTMTFRNIVFCLCAVTALTACETLYPQQKQHPYAAEVVELPKRPTKSRYELPPGMITENMDTASLMTNESVIVFPVDGHIDPTQKTFPEYRSVIENTTAGGYTVFDPSVTVFAVDDTGGRPEYLPEYSVPRYTEQIFPRQTAQTPQPVVMPSGNGLVPMMQDNIAVPSTTPSEPIHLRPGVVSIAPDIQAEPLPRPPRMTAAGRVSTPDARPAARLTTSDVVIPAAPTVAPQPQQRRSRPVLTGY